MLQDKVDLPFLVWQLKWELRAALAHAGSQAALPLSLPFMVWWAKDPVVMTTSAAISG